VTSSPAWAFSPTLSQAKETTTTAKHDSKLTYSSWVLVAYVCGLVTQEVEIRRIMVQSQPWLETLPQKENPTQNRAGGASA
jgi:hypothetical protein